MRSITVCDQNGDNFFARHRLPPHISFGISITLVVECINHTVSYWCNGQSNKVSLIMWTFVTSGCIYSEVAMQQKLLVTGTL